MIRLSALPLFPAILAAASHAGEITIEPHPFTIEKSFNATAMPDVDGTLIQIEPKTWTDYQIVDLAAHGSKVSKGDVLVRFDAENIDKKLVDVKRWLESNALNIAQAEADLKNLVETSPHKLDAYRRAAEIAKEENSYFTKTRRKATEETAAQAVEHKKQMLSNQKEELRQLTKMYAADDVTEETEEIILTRQKEDVVTAEFNLRMEELDYKRTLEVTLPREAVSLANNERDTAINLLKAEQDIPRAISLKKLELETLKTTHQREKDALAELEHDRTLFEIKAPSDGWFYHGPIENGRWTPTEAVKTLFKHGRPLPNRPFATFVPAKAKLGIVAFVEDGTARSLKDGLAGIAVLSGREDVEVPVKIAKIAETPGTDGTFRADLTATWPAEPATVAGASVQARFIAYNQAAAIAVPTKAVTYDAKGWTVEVKLADGKTERRPVKRGRVSGDNTEILSGLEAGQVIIAP